MQLQPMQQIDIAAGSVQGHTHRRTGQNNQDAFAWAYLNAATNTATNTGTNKVKGINKNIDNATDKNTNKNIDNATDKNIDNATDKNTNKNIDNAINNAIDTGRNQGGAIAIICDGCGSCPSSEVGAQLGAQWVINAVAQQLQTQTAITEPSFWCGVEQTVLGQMRSLTDTLNGPATHATNGMIIQSYLLFTIIGAVLTPETTVVFGLGDGIFAINDNVQAIGPFANNAPPYLAYGLMPESYSSFSPEDLQLKIHRQLPTAEVRSLLIGSDGVEDLRAIADQPLPPKNEPIGDVSQFWQGDRYFKNPDMVRRRLALINREQTKPDWANQHLTKTGGLLPDDTTLVVMRTHGTHPLVISREKPTP